MYRLTTRGLVEKTKKKVNELIKDKNYVKN